MIPIWVLKNAIFSAKIAYPLWMSLKAIITEDSQKMRSWLIYWIISLILSFIFRFSDRIYFTFENFVPALYYEMKLVVYFIMVYPEGSIVDLIEMNFMNYWNCSGRSVINNLYNVIEPYIKNVLTVVNQKIAIAKSMRSSSLNTTTLEASQRTGMTADTSAEENKPNDNNTASVKATEVINNETMAEGPAN